MEIDSDLVAQQPGTSRLAVHRVNLYRPLPTSINSMALSPCNKFLAVVRGFANVRAALERLATPVCTIEIYRVYSGASTVSILEIHQKESLQSIAWFDFTTVVTVSINQNINLYNTDTGELLFQEMSDYGPIYCLKHEPSLSLLVTGTEYGYVCAYKCDYKNKTLSFWKKLVKVPNRILSIDCYIDKIQTNKRPETKERIAKKRKKATSDSSSSDDDDEEEDCFSCGVKVFGGSLGDVVVWDLKTESILETIHVGEESVVIWDLLTTSAGDLVIGDSSGATSIFDANTFICKQRINLHSADVLCLSKTDSENEIYISGIDNAIRSIGKYTDADVWVPKTKRYAHTHDVRSLATFLDKELFSGGSDYFLTHTCYPDSKKTFFMPDLTENVKFSSPDELMVKNEASLIIWKLADYSLNELDNHVSGYTLPLNSEPQKIVELRTRSFILTSAFNSSWICYYTIGASNISLYRRSQSHNYLRKYRLTTKLTDCHKMELAEVGDCQLLVVISSGSLFLISLEFEEGGEKSCIVIDEHKLACYVQQLYAVDSKLIISTRCKNQSYIHLFEINTEHKLHFTKKLDLGPIGISFFSTYPAYLQPEVPELFVYTHESIIIKVNLEDLTITKTPVIGLPEHSTIIGMFFISHDGFQRLAIYDYKNIFKLDLQDRGYQTSSTITRYSHIIKVLNTGNRYGTDELCLVELTPEQLVKLLPPVLKKRKFGG